MKRLHSKCSQIHIFEDSFLVQDDNGTPEVKEVYYEAEPNMLALCEHKILSCGVMVLK